MKKNTIINRAVNTANKAILNGKKTAIIGLVGLLGFGSLTSCTKENDNSSEYSIIHTINLSYNIKDGNDAQIKFDEIFMEDLLRINQDYFDLTDYKSKKFVQVNIKINSSVDNINLTNWWYARHFAALCKRGELEGSNWVNVQGLSVDIDFGKIKNITVYENNIKNSYKAMFKQDWDTPYKSDPNKSAISEYVNDIATIKNAGFNVVVERNKTLDNAKQDFAKTNVYFADFVKQSKVK